MPESKITHEQFRVTLGNFLEAVEDYLPLDDENGYSILIAPRFGGGYKIVIREGVEGRRLFGQDIIK